MLTALLSQAQSPCRHDTGEAVSSYQIVSVKDYSFSELLDEGVGTASRQLDILHIPIRQFGFVVKAYIRSHHFALGMNKRRKATFRAVAFAYPSLSPTGEPVMLSGLVVIPLLGGNRPSGVLLYHRLLAASNTIAPSNSLPAEAALAADNTVCVFPDYYGCGTTEGEPLPFVAFNYHARCATQCLLAALDIVGDQGVAMADGFHTWNTGYSQGAGYALATQKYIETELPDSVARRLNLRWSFCGGGVYSPDRLFRHAIESGDLGSSPAVYLQSLRGMLHYDRAFADSIPLRALLSERAIHDGIDTLLLTRDDGLWELSSRIEGLDGISSPADFFSSAVTDTSSELFRTVMKAFALDGCTSGWNPKAPIAFLHSQCDSLAPIRLTHDAILQLSANGASCTLSSPRRNGSHSNTAFKYFRLLLRLSEDRLYSRYVK